MKRHARRCEETRAQGGVESEHRSSALLKKRGGGSPLPLACIAVCLAQRQSRASCGGIPWRGTLYPVPWRDTLYPVPWRGTLRRAQTSARARCDTPSAARSERSSRESCVSALAASLLYAESLLTHIACSGCCTGYRLVDKARGASQAWGTPTRGACSGLKDTGIVSGQVGVLPLHSAPRAHRETEYADESRVNC